MPAWAQSAAIAMQTIRPCFHGYGIFGIYWVGVTRGLYKQPRAQARAVIITHSLVSTDGCELNSEDICVTERVH